MNIVIDDPRIESLVRRIAAVDGVSVETVISESLVSLAKSRGVTPLDGKPLRERLAALACEADLVPRSLDQRTDDDILGYDGHGTW
jgi:hypothetical protein